MSLYRFILCLFLSLTSTVLVFAQEEAQVQTEGKRYLDLRIKALERYERRISAQQERLLQRLQQKEQHLLKRLRHTDSAAYARLSRQSPDYDSIRRMRVGDSSNAVIFRRRNPETDSLKAVAGFLGSGGGNTAAEEGRLNQLRPQLNYRRYINDLISQRTRHLQASAGNTALFTGIDKQVYYARSRMQVFKDMEKDPSVAESKAYEYLSGTQGFDDYMHQSGPANGMQSITGNRSNSDLQQMGLQTRQQVEGALQQKFGNSLGQISGKMSGQIKDFQDKTKQLSQAGKTLQSAKKIRVPGQPSFPVNPMRGLPFRKRLEKQYNVQTTRATQNGTPAILQASAMLGFRQSPSLSFGTGITAGIGLGQSWSNVRLNMQGLGFRTYAAWQWQYGLGAYAGYERTYRLRPAMMQEQSMMADTHQNGLFTESVLTGITKKYRLNDKWNGSVQLLYDIWWRQNGAAGPLLLRFATITR